MTMGVERATVVKESAANLNHQCIAANSQTSIHDIRIITIRRTKHSDADRQGLQIIIQIVIQITIQL